MEYSSKLACLLALAFAMAAALVAAPCAAQNSPQDYVYQHNVARAKVGVGAVSWDGTLEAYAQSYADLRRGDCKLVNSDGNGGQYGENLSVGLAGTDWTGANAVNDWVSQNKYYNYGSNTCSENWLVSCGLYTQVVWRNSTAIGCARDVCDNDGGVFIICSYYPAGNVDGQRPY